MAGERAKTARRSTFRANYGPPRLAYPVSLSLFLPYGRYPAPHPPR
jgi:hypothetical protein